MRTRLGGLAAVAALVTTGLTGSALADPGDVPAPGSRAHAIAQDASADQAEAALAEVAVIFGDTPPGSGELSIAPRAGSSAAAPGREATLALRDLYAAKGSLTGEARVAAERYLARPTDGPSDPGGDGYTVVEAPKKCTTHICVHYVASTVDAPPLADTNPANGVPDYVDLAKTTLEHVHTTYTGAGYKAPKSDLSSDNNGGNAKTDIYLADIGDDGLYGYCTSDDPSTNSFDISAYCVLDNDYNAEQYPANTPAENFQVTAAHEYFHAVQFAYDFLEDGWFMEASATWAEDELYDDVNDNVSYLEEGQLAEPETSLDTFTGLFHYGNWIFLRYLTERFPAEAGGLPTFMRKLWDKVDAATQNDPDMYAIQAIKKELARRNTSFTKIYARYADAMRRQASFSEGVANDYPVKPLAGQGTLSAGAPATGWVSRQLNHMTSATYRLIADAGLTGNWRLKLNFDLADRVKGSAAIVTVYPQVGAKAVIPVALNDSGNGSLDVGFSVAEVTYVEVTLVNASSRFDCWIPPYDSPYSCLGNPRDDNLIEKFKATAVETL